MNTITTLIRIEIWFFLIGMMIVVGYQILTGRISIRGLLSEKNGTGSYSTVRIQLLTFTLISTFYYIFQILGNPGEFPKVSNELLLMMGGSNAVYLGGKSYSLLLRR